MQIGLTKRRDLADFHLARCDLFVSDCYSPLRSFPTGFQTDEGHTAFVPLTLKTHQDSVKTFQRSPFSGRPATVLASANLCRSFLSSINSQPVIKDLNARRKKVEDGRRGQQHHFLQTIERMTRKPCASELSTRHGLLSLRTNCRNESAN